MKTPVLTLNEGFCPTKRPKCQPFVCSALLVSGLEPARRGGGLPSAPLGLLPKPWPEQSAGPNGGSLGSPRRVHSTDSYPQALLGARLAGLAPSEPQEGNFSGSQYPEPGNEGEARGRGEHE